MRTLMLVIAILLLLAGLGIVGYAGYEYYSVNTMDLSRLPPDSRNFISRLVAEKSQQMLLLGLSGLAAIVISIPLLILSRKRRATADGRS